MPVQINEVIIKAVVDTTTSSGAGISNPAPSSDRSNGEAAIAEKVLEILREKQER
jgi:hypothetical protein